MQTFFWHIFILQTHLYLKTSESGCLYNFYADQRTDSLTLFNELGWLLFHCDVHISRGCDSYAATILKRLTGRAPEYMEIILVRNSDRHQRNTRFAYLNLRCPCYCKALLRVAVLSPSERRRNGMYSPIRN